MVVKTPRRGCSEVLQRQPAQGALQPMQKCNTWPARRQRHSQRANAREICALLGAPPEQGAYFHQIARESHPDASEPAARTEQACFSQRSLLLSTTAGRSSCFRSSRSSRSADARLHASIIRPPIVRPPIIRPPIIRPPIVRTSAILLRPASGQTPEACCFSRAARGKTHAAGSGCCRPRVQVLM